MVGVLVALGIIALLGGAFYLRRTMPWPFEFEGKKYRRMSDGTFQDATKMPVVDAALTPKLVVAYEAAKYGDRELQGWDSDNS